MKANGTRTVVELSRSKTASTVGYHRRDTDNRILGGSVKRNHQQLQQQQQQQLLDHQQPFCGSTYSYQQVQHGQRTPANELEEHRRPPTKQRMSLHSVAKPKLVPRFTRLQVLRIIKLATMDKLADDPAGASIRQQAAPGGEGEGVGVVGVKREGDGPSDEYHHQFYNTGRIGRRNALPDILGTHCTTTTADLSSQLGALSTSECTGKSPEEGNLAPANNGAQPPTTTAT
ncbi:uncharacterized protein LOC126570155 [Anopheles aquasalis]|uniref:uncharacterized protein LOC126570155 n=1 Tax=Anopheles aquasalis TaxID=42839 RepID=UPI00215B6EC2|nr:uncharacterized protein LOC126570155 [Anopheles aquasalis]XP_050083655.1 uncharacterized protein LOC126570155 [Anopheles aquasalis]